MEITLVVARHTRCCSEVLSAITLAMRFRLNASAESTRMLNSLSDGYESSMEERKSKELHSSEKTSPD